MTAAATVAAIVAATVAATPAAAAARDCEDLYFGISGPSDFGAAYACFDRRRAGKGGDPTTIARALAPWGPMIVMRLEGDGAPVDLEEAEALLAEWKSVDERASPLRLLLSRIVLERRAGLAPAASHLDLCELLGDESLDFDCEEVDRRRRQAQVSRRLDELRARLPAAARAELAGLTSAFGVYVSEEEERVERSRIPGEGDPDAAGESDRLRTEFDATARDVLQVSFDPEASAVEARRRESAVNRGFEESLAGTESELAAFERALPDDAASWEERRREAIASGRRSQAAWERYRDAWVAVVRAAAESPDVADRAEWSLRARLATQRERQLRGEVGATEGPLPRGVGATEGPLPRGVGATEGPLPRGVGAADGPERR